MTLIELVKYFKELALAQPNVMTARDGNVYDIMNANPSQNYKAFVITQQNHREDEYDDIYSLTLFMVDRLVDDRESNRLMIQSLCKEQLSNIIRAFVENVDIDFPDNVNYVTFTQKFKDSTAGAYAQLEIIIPRDSCIDGMFPTYRSGEIKLEAKTVDITENGVITVLPVQGYDGMTKVTLNVNVPSGGDYQQGYEDGYAKGKEDQKGLLQELNTVVNGTFETENGYSKVTVNVPTGEGDYEKGFQDGYAAGVADQKKKLESITIDTNGTYEREDGYNKIVVNVPSGSDYTPIQLTGGVIELDEKGKYCFVFDDNTDLRTVIKFKHEPSPEPKTDCSTLAYQTTDGEIAKFEYGDVPSRYYDSNVKDGDWCILTKNIPFYNVEWGLFYYTDTEKYSNNRITAVKLPDCSSFVQISPEAFVGQELTNIEIPSSVKYIQYRAFSGNKLHTIKLNEGLETIEGGAFSSLGKGTLTTVTIPSTVTEIGNLAFNNSTYVDGRNCTIIDVVMKSKVPVQPEPEKSSTGEERWIPFGNNPDLKIYVPNDAVDAYKATWTEYTDKIRPISER